MFYLYGVGGQVYRGTMQDMMPRVEPVQRTTPAQPLDLGRDTATMPFGLGEEEDSPVPRPVQEAMSAYAQAATAATPPQRQPLTRAEQLMTLTPITIAHDLPAHEAEALLDQHRIGQLPVLGPRGNLVGMVMRPERLPRGFVVRAPRVAPGQSPRASDVMVTPVPAAAPDTQLRQVARVLLDLDLPGMAVTVEDGQVTGFIGRTDLIRAIAQEPPLDLWT
jgi:CBS domain-containing protein